MTGQALTAWIVIMTYRTMLLWGVDVMFMQNHCRAADVCACDVSGVSMRLHGDVRETVGTL
jgi:hypothetical protein